MKRERGSVAVELAIVALALMLLVLGVLQFGLWYHVQNVVETAAMEGARAAAAEDGTSGAGRTRAIEVLQEGLGQAAGDEGATVLIDQDVARVEVTAQLPGQRRSQRSRMAAASRTYRHGSSASNSTSPPSHSISSIRRWQR